MGPTQDYVLHDLGTWLKDQARKVRNLGSQLQTAETVMEELRGQLGDLNSKLDQQTFELENQVTELQSESTDMQNTVIELERHNMELQSALDSAKNLTYLALGVALIAVMSGVVIIFQNLTVFCEDNGRLLSSTSTSFGVPLSASDCFWVLAGVPSGCSATSVFPRFPR
jgi:hypothetical protein